MRRVLPPAVVAAVLITGAACGGTAGPAYDPAGRPATAPGGQIHVEVIVADAAAAARVAVHAPSARETAVVRGVLAALGPRGAIRSVRLSATGPGDGKPTITITPSAAPPASAALLRGAFEAMAVGDAVGRLLPRYRSLTIDGPEGFGSGLGLSGPAAAVAPAALAASVRAGLAAAGLDVRSITILPLPVPAVETVIRLREGQLFDESAHHWEAATAAGPVGRPPSGFLVVESPAGAAISTGGHVGGFGFGSGGVPADAPVPATAPAALRRAPTRVEITLRRGAPGEHADAAWTLDCRRPGASTLPDPRAACDRVLRDRWALFAPAETGVACSLPGGGDMIEIHGVFAGRAIDFAADGCRRWTLDRWERFLRVPPRP